MTAEPQVALRICIAIPFYSGLDYLEVALRSGWNSASQFHAAFRRNVGVTPARYRAANRG